MKKIKNDKKKLEENKAILDKEERKEKKKERKEKQLRILKQILHPILWWFLFSREGFEMRGILKGFCYKSGKACFVIE